MLADIIVFGIGIEKEPDGYTTARDESGSREGERTASLIHPLEGHAPSWPLSRVSLIITEEMSLG